MDRTNHEGVTKTRPMSDRKRFGGVKFREMEMNCLLAYGESANLHERLFTISESSQMSLLRLWHRRHRRPAARRRRPQDQRPLLPPLRLR